MCKLISTLFLITIPCFTLNNQWQHAEATSKQLHFIKKLFNEKRYFDCIAETRRYLFFSPKIDDETKTKLNYFIASNYYYGSQYLSAAKTIREELPSDFLCGKILLSQAYKKLGLLEQSLSTLNDISYPHNDYMVCYEIFVRKIESLIVLGKYDDAMHEINVQRQFFNSAKLSELSAAISSFSQKSKFDTTRAMWYSAIVPGAGQWYAKRYYDGILSFAAVLGAGLSAIYFHTHGDTQLRNFSVVFCTIFYAGNVYGAYNSAQKANRAITESFTSSIIHNYIPPYDPLRCIEISNIVP